MANQTITTTVNYDDASISGLLNGESLTINGGSVTFDADVRWNQQAAVFGDILISDTLGGGVTFDGTKIWEIPFSAATGNVPTQNALGSNGVSGGTSGATGELTRVWATGSLEPSASGGAMPATGFIKLRSKTGTFQAGETITLPGGATVTATNAGKRSWVHLVGRAVSTGTGSRLFLPNLGKFSCVGDWYELGTTNGADNQTFQFPVADSCPAIWMETSPGSDTYEIWLNAGDRWTDGAMATSDRRGMYFGQNLTTGVITIALRGGTNAGYKPVSGCKVKIPNLIFSQANGTAGTWSANYLPTNIGFRYYFDGTGSISLQKCSLTWNLFLTSRPSITLQNLSGLDFIQLNSIKNGISLDNVAIGIIPLGGNNISCQILTTNNISITNCFFARRVNGSNGISRFNLCQNITIQNTRCDSFGALNTQSQFNQSNGAAVVFAIVNNATINNLTAIGCAGVYADNASNLTITNMKFASRSSGSNVFTAFPALAANSDVSDVIMEGFSIFENLADVPPNTFASIGNSRNIKVQNIGTPSSPISFGPLRLVNFLISAVGSVNCSFRRIYVDGVLNILNDNANSSGILLVDVRSQTSQNNDFRGSDLTWRGVTALPLIPNTFSNIIGIHWRDIFLSSSSGAIDVLCYEPSASTLSQVVANFDAATFSGWSGTNGVVLASTADSIEWIMPYFALGHTALSNTNPTLSGTNTANLTFDFQFDTGAGFNGTWLSLTGVNLSGVGAINPAVGIKLKIRATVNTANVNNFLQNIRISTATNTAAQLNQYPLPGSILNVSNLQPNSRVKVSRVDTGAVLAQSFSGAGTSIQFDLPYTGAVLVEARNASTSPAYQPWITQTSISALVEVTVIALQQVD